MNYKIIIEKKEQNPNFESELAKCNESSRGCRYETMDYPINEVTTNALICELTEEQFKAVKAAVMKSFE